MDWVLTIMQTSRFQGRTVLQYFATQFATTATASASNSSDSSERFRAIRRHA